MEYNERSLWYSSGAMQGLNEAGWKLIVEKSVGWADLTGHIPMQEADLARHKMEA